MDRKQIAATYQPQLTRTFLCSIFSPVAQMAELVDALGSGPSGSNTVQVRVLFWAFSIMDATPYIVRSCIFVFPRNDTQKGTQTPRKGMKKPCTIADAGWKTRMKTPDGYWAPSGICTQRLVEALQRKCEPFQDLSCKVHLKTEQNFLLVLVPL